MADAPVPSLNRAREQKINELSQHFANDDLTIEELERRIELVYKAGTVADLEAITADLGIATPAPVARDATSVVPRRVLPTDARRGRLLAIMGESRRTGRWLVPGELRVVSLMSDTPLDLTQAVMATGTSEIRAISPNGSRWNPSKRSSLTARI